LFDFEYLMVLSGTVHSVTEKQGCQVEELYHLLPLVAMVTQHNLTIFNQAIDIPASSSGVHLPFSYYDIAANTGSGIQFGNHGNTDGFYKSRVDTSTLCTSLL
jgi:hypothetical protein